MSTNINAYCSNDHPKCEPEFNMLTCFNKQIHVNHFDVFTLFRTYEWLSLVFDKLEKVFSYQKTFTFHLYHLIPLALSRTGFRVFCLVARI